MAVACLSRNGHNSDKLMHMLYFAIISRILDFKKTMGKPIEGRAVARAITQCVSLYIILFFCLSLVLWPEVNKRVNESKTDHLRNQHKLVLLIGASIGRHWNFSSLPERIDNSDVVFEYVPGGGFDKSDTLKNVLSRKENKPNVILLKECAAYFPGEMSAYKDLMMKWISDCIEADVVPIPATVVPVTRLHSFKQIMIDVLKRRNPFRYGNPFTQKRNRAILAYNDWIREYCNQKGLALLDLEAAVRYSEKNRYLREDFAKIDGLHLNNKAYKVLDQIVIPTLRMVDDEIKLDE